MLEHKDKKTRQNLILNKAYILVEDTHNKQINKQEKFRI